MTHSSHPLPLFTVAALSLSGLLACASSGANTSSTSSPAPAPANAPAPAANAAADSAGPDLNGICVATFARQRECSDQFIPALVDARVRANKPAGITQAAATEGRASLIERARKEWQSDSQPEAVTARCARMMSEVPADQREAMGAQAASCLGQQDCNAFVSCVMPLVESHLR